MSQELERLLKDIRACRLCTDLPLGPRPVLHVQASARILIVGQAPGTRVHATGQSWNDPSGDRMRRWMGIDRATFYDESKIALASMAFCYPGKAKRGDLPPRPECAPHWREKLHAHLPNIQLTLLFGQYAQAWYLGKRRGKTLAETVAKWQDYMPEFLPLPHPSPRNIRWFQRHPWVEADIVPALRERVHELLELETPRKTA